MAQTDSSNEKESSLRAEGTDSGSLAEGKQNEEERVLTLGSEGDCCALQVCLILCHRSVCIQPPQHILRPLSPIIPVARSPPCVSRFLDHIAVFLPRIRLQTHSLPPDRLIWTAIALRFSLNLNLRLPSRSPVHFQRVRSRHRCPLQKPYKVLVPASPLSVPAPKPYKVLVPAWPVICTTTPETVRGLSASTAVRQYHRGCGDTDAEAVAYLEAWFAVQPAQSGRSNAWVNTENSIADAQDGTLD
eukprot:641122-Rhodomonas_salina.1